MITEWIAPDSSSRWVTNSIAGGWGGTISTETPYNPAVLSDIQSDDDSGFCYYTFTVDKTAAWTPSSHWFKPTVKIGSVAATLMAGETTLTGSMATYTFGNLDDGVDGMTDFYSSWGDTSKINLRFDFGIHYPVSANDATNYDEMTIPVLSNIQNKKAIINGIQLKVLGFAHYVDSGSGSWINKLWFDYIAIRIKYSPNGLFFGMG